MTTTRIPLSRPIQGPQGEIAELSMRLPQWDDIMPVGSPYTVHSSKDGNKFVVENNEAIEHYARACLVEPKDASLLRQLGPIDTLKVREAVLDFFTPGFQASPSSNAQPPVGSSSSSDTPPNTSAA